MGIQNSWRRGRSQNCGIRIGRRCKKEYANNTGCNVSGRAFERLYFNWYGTRLHRNEGIHSVLEKSQRLCTEKWFPENEGTNIFVVKGGLSGYSSYESDMKKTSPWMIYNLIGDLRLNNLGKRQVIKNFQIVFEIFLSIV